MRKNKIILAVFIFLSVILASVAIVQEESLVSKQLPYTIGSPVANGSQMPIGMVMKTFDVLPPEPVPTITFDITKDSMDGWNVHATTTNFTFTPEKLNGVSAAGEGHIHLYIDNQLIIMLGPWYHIDSLTPGTHTIKVGLFNNDHSAYSVNGNQIEAQQTITVR